jgi:chromosomal replication initiation ATPase DnaA
MGEELVSPLRKVYGGVILGSKQFIRDALERVKFERVKSPEVSHRKAMRSALGAQEIISACCEHFGVAREEITQNRRSEARKACVYLIKRHTCASNREIGQLFGSLTYSAVAKIAATVSKRLESDKYLREQIKGLEAKYSFFKG